MELIDAILARKSNRKYKTGCIPSGVLDGVKNLVKNVKPLYPVDTRIHVVEDGVKVQKVVSGFVGSYGKVYAPHYLVVTSEIPEDMNTLYRKSRADAKRKALSDIVTGMMSDDMKRSWRRRGWRLRA